MRVQIIRHARTHYVGESQSCMLRYSFLLEGLHEDTNRVRGKKPWVELKDIGGEADEAMQQRYWENHTQVRCVWN